MQTKRGQFKFTVEETAKLKESYNLTRNLQFPQKLVAFIRIECVPDELFQGHFKIALTINQSNHISSFRHKAILATS